MNVVENDKNYELEFAVPGLKKEDLQLQIDADGIMSISMTCKETKEDNKPNYIRREFAYREFNKSYILPDDTDREKITAKVENGVLSINLPKLEVEDKKSAVKTITIG